MERNDEDYARMIDRLSTAVAIFDKSKRLTFHNAAYSQMWSLEPAFLDTHPTDGEILDRLRAKRQLPEQADFRAWKAQLMEAYQAPEPSETVWYLPDGRALRVVTSPNPKGGVTYLYDDATQSYALASQVTALTHVQGETLDALKEGVAVFGADGRMKLFNPVFAEMWRIDPARLADHPHIDAIAEGCRALCREPASWDGLRGMVVGLHEHRAILAARIERTDDLTFDCAALPLPDGATLLTFLDVTASANVERALTERNEALVAAEKLRNDFVNHVSYELRTPLTNIIGFTQLLAAGGVGPAEPEAARVRRLHHQLLARAARDHRRHSRPRLDRRRRAGAAPRAGRRRRGDARRRSRRAGPARRGVDRAPHGDRPTASAPSPPTAGACARRCSTSCPTRSIIPSPDRR